MLNKVFTALPTKKHVVQKTILFSFQIKTIFKCNSNLGYHVIYSHKTAIARYNFRQLFENQILYFIAIKLANRFIIQSVMHMNKLTMAPYLKVH